MDRLGLSSFRMYKWKAGEVAFKILTVEDCEISVKM
jgi:hypothetical protein